MKVNPEAQIKAEARYLRISPQKARLVVDLIRGKQAGAALSTLRTTNKRIARRKATRFSSCSAIDSLTSCASSSGLWTS